MMVDTTKIDMRNCTFDTRIGASGAEVMESDGAYFLENEKDNIIVIIKVGIADCPNDYQAGIYGSIGDLFRFFSRHQKSFKESDCDFFKEIAHKKVVVNACFLISYFGIENDQCPTMRGLEKYIKDYFYNPDKNAYDYDVFYHKETLKDIIKTMLSELE